MLYVGHHGTPALQSRTPIRVRRKYMAHDPLPQIAAVRGRRLGFRRTTMCDRVRRTYHCAKKLDHPIGPRSSVALALSSCSNVREQSPESPIIPFHRRRHPTNQKSAVYRRGVRYVRGRGVEKNATMRQERRETRARADCGAHNQPRRVTMTGKKTVKEYVLWGRVQRERILFLFSFFGVGRGTENLEGDGELPAGSAVEVGCVIIG